MVHEKRIKFAIQKTRKEKKYNARKLLQIFYLFNISRTTFTCACKPAVKQQYLNKNLFRRLNDKSKKEKCYDTEDRKKR